MSRACRLSPIRRLPVRSCVVSDRLRLGVNVQQRSERNLGIERDRYRLIPLALNLVRRRLLLRHHSKRSAAIGWLRVYETDRQKQTDDAYRAIGRYIVEFSSLVWCMRSLIETRLVGPLAGETPDDDDEEMLDAQLPN